MSHAASPPRKVSRPAGTNLTLAAIGAALLGLCGCRTGMTDADIRMISADEVRALVVRQEDRPEGTVVTLVDTRASKWFDLGRLPGAINRQLPDVPEKGAVEPLLAAAPVIVVYGRNPGDVAARGVTKRIMAQLWNSGDNWRKVRLFSGGLSEWISLGYRVDQPTPPADAAPSEAGAPAGAGPDPADQPAR